MSIKLDIYENKICFYIRNPHISVILNHPENSLFNPSDFLEHNRKYFPPNTEGKLTLSKTMVKDKIEYFVYFRKNHDLFTRTYALGRVPFRLEKEIEEKIPTLRTDKGRIEYIRYYSDRNISIKVSFPIKGLTRKRVPLCNFDI